MEEEPCNHEKLWVNSNHMFKERREDNGSDNLSDSSSAVDGKTKDKGWVWCTTQAGPLNEADIFTKNLPGPVFDNFDWTLIGKNEYIHSCATK